MLQNIRDRATGWIAYVIVIGISIPFALWGIDQYFTGGNIIVAEVNDTKISAERLNGEYQDRLREMQSIISKDQDEAELQKRKESENIKNKEKKDIGWGHQIRSYVLHPYKLIKDLRNGYETSNVNDVLNGKINNFLENSLTL